MIRHKFGNSTAAVAAALLALVGSPEALAEEDWFSGNESEWKHHTLAQVDSYGASTSALEFGLQSHPDTDSNLPTLLADASGAPEKGEKATSAKCAEFEKDIDADIGDIIRAGCKPTTAQMSKLMNNPLGNVAMWVNQFDLYSWRTRPTARQPTKPTTWAFCSFQRRSARTGT